jgi:hypothetical protein
LVWGHICARFRGQLGLAVTQFSFKPFPGQSIQCALLEEALALFHSEAIKHEAISDRLQPG